MPKRIGIINSGGDCPGLNTVIDAVVRCLVPDYEVLGFYKGFEGLLEKNYLVLDPKFTSLIKFDGGTFLKSVNKGNFAGKVAMGKINQIDPEILERTLKNYKELELEALVVLGGDGTMATTLQLQKYGLNIIGVPKSIDNDLQGTDYTFGFHTAVEITTEALDRITTTARSHDRVMVMEVMGRHAGWIALYSGLAGGAHAILIPEIPYDKNKIIQHFQNRYANGKTHGIIVVAEGATEISQIGASTADIGSSSSEAKLGGAGDHLTKLLNVVPEFEARTTVLGHIQRGGSPVGWDRILSRTFGSYAAKMVREQRYASMVGYKNGEFGVYPLEICADKIKLVDTQSDLMIRARELGVCFGE